MGYMPPWRNRSCKGSSPTPNYGRWVCAVAVGLILTLFGRNGLAQRVVLVRPSGTDVVLTEAFNRIRAELKLQLFEVVVTDSRGINPIQSTADAANAENALAAVSLSQQNNGASVEVCIVDRATGKTSLRRLALDNVQDAPSVLAIRAVDLLRASLREFAPTETPAPEIRDVERKAPADVHKVRVWASPNRRRTSARLGAAMLDTSAGITTAYGIDLAIDYAVTERASVGGWLLGPLVFSRFESPGGTAAIRQEMAAIRASYQLLPPSVVELRPTIGFGAYHLDAHADVNPGLVSKRGQVFSLLACLGLSAAFRLSQTIGFEIESNAIMLTPRPGVAVADRQVLFRRAVVSAAFGVRTSF